MRLTCPNCDAQYEVPDAAIPTEGREVQCSNCGNLWFHAHPDHPRQDLPEEPETVEPTVAITDAAPSHEPVQAGDIPQADDDANADEDALDDQAAEDDVLPPRREIDPVVIEILRAEAEREVKLRAAEKGGTRNTPAAPDKAPGDEIVDQSQDPVTESPAKPGRDALPDLAAPDSGPSDNSPPDTPAEQPATSRPGNAGGFKRGFALVIIVASVFVVVYAWADRIAESVPQTAPVLESYVANVNQMRVWLDSTLNSYLPK
jgi:predicted Zn finger-like uncharacterized protein